MRVQLFLSTVLFASARAATEYSAHVNSITDRETPLKQLTHPAFANAGKQVGLEVWRIENFEPVPVPPSEHINLHNGDSYIVLKTTENNQGDLSWDVQYRIGRDNNLEEAKAATMFTASLDNKFIMGDGATTTHGAHEDKKIVKRSVNDYGYGRYDMRNGHVGHGSVIGEGVEFGNSAGNGYGYGRYNTRNAAHTGYDSVIGGGAESGNWAGNGYGYGRYNTRNGAHVGQGTVIGDGAELGNWAVIGDGAAIRRGAVIRDAARIGDGSVIGQNAVIGRGAIIGRGAMVRDGSVVPDQAVIADGSIA